MIVHKNIFNVLNMQKNSWNVISFFHILIIETLQLKKPSPQSFLIIQLIVPQSKIFKIL